MFNVLKIMNKIDISQDKVYALTRQQKMTLVSFPGVCYPVPPASKEKWQDSGGWVHQPSDHQRGRVQGNRQEQGRVPDPGRAQDVQQVSLYGGGGWGEAREGKHRSIHIKLLQVIEEHDQNYDKKLNILEYRGFLEDEVRHSKDESLSNWPYWDVIYLTIKVEEELKEKEADQTLTEKDHQDLQRLRDFLNSDQWIVFSFLILNKNDLSSKPFKF